MDDLPFAAKTGPTDPRLDLINEWRVSTGRDVRLTRLETDPAHWRVRELTPTREVLTERILMDGEDPVDVALEITGLDRYAKPQRWIVRLDDPTAERAYLYDDIEALTVCAAKREAARRAIATDKHLHTGWQSASDQAGYTTAVAQYAVIERCAPTTK